MDEEKQPFGFESSKKKASKVLDDNERLKTLLRKAKEKAAQNNIKLKGVWSDFQTLLRFLQAWRRREYKEISWRTLLYSTAAVLYFVNPFDLIPDIVPLTGLVDDFAVITFALNAIQKDLLVFKKWEQTNDLTTEE